MLKETMATILAKDGLRKAFLILTGVIQGDTLASFLVVPLDHHYHCLCDENSTKIFPAVKVIDVNFANDLVLTTIAAAEAQNLLLSVKLVSAPLNCIETKSRPNTLRSISRMITPPAS